MAIMMEGAVAPRIWSESGPPATTISARPDAASGAHLWADRFEGELADVFQLQDRVSEAVAGVIAPTIEYSEIQRARRSPARSLDAYDVHLQALAQYYEMTEESFARSAKLFDRALRLDPYYAPALLYGLRVISMRAAQGWAAPSDIMQTSLDYSERALRLAKDDAEVLATVSRIRSFFFGANEELLDLAKRATENNPNSASAWMHCGWVHMWAAQPHEAVGYLERAIRLSPRDTSKFETLAGLAGALIQLGRHDEAAASARRSVQQGPNFSPGWRFLTAALRWPAARRRRARRWRACSKSSPCAASVHSRRATACTARPMPQEGLRLAGLTE